MIAGQPEKIVYPDGKFLLPHHRGHLQTSGLTEQTIRNARVFSEINIATIKSLLDKKPKARGYSSKNGPAIVFPFYDLAGNVVLHRVRPDQPNVIGGREAKYLSPTGAGVRAYLPPAARDAVDHEGRIFITEGEKKSLALSQHGFTAIGLCGVACWHSKGEMVLLPELQRFRWRGRTVYIVFDSDAVDNEAVKAEEAKLAATLQRLNARVLVVRLPPDESGGKQGADDFIVASGASAFEKLVEEAQEPDAIDLAELELRPDASKVDTLVAAKVLCDMSRRRDEDLMLRYHKGSFYEWRRGCYKVKPRDEFRAVVSGALAESYRRVTGSFTSSVIELLGSLTLVPSTSDTPCWLPDWQGENTRPVTWNLRDCLATRKAILHLPSVGTDEDCSIEATPRLFTIAASDIEFDPEAPKPTAWLAFLRSIFMEQHPDDEVAAVQDAKEAILALQQWFGYLLTPDTRQHKILMMVGPPRSGKGTVTRILSQLVGKANVGGPTLASLGQNFGMQSLVDKSLAVISDARLGSKTDQAVIIERLLSISGEDTLMIDRKHRDPIDQRLPTRLMILSNELPRFRDESEALHNRFVILETKQSFLGREDIELEARLSEELPGILNWAIEGWQALQDSGRLFEPAESKQIKQDYICLTSPVAQFIDRRCQLGDGWTSTQELYRTYRDFCESIGQRHVENQVHFARNLVGHVRDRIRKGKMAKVKGYYGISINRGGDG